MGLEVLISYLMDRLRAVSVPSISALGADVLLSDDSPNTSVSYCTYIPQCSKKWSHTAHVNVIKSKGQR